MSSWVPVSWPVVLFVERREVVLDDDGVGGGGDGRREGQQGGGACRWICPSGERGAPRPLWSTTELSKPKPGAGAAQATKARGDRRQHQHRDSEEPQPASIRGAARSTGWRCDKPDEAFGSSCGVWDREWSSCSSSAMIRTARPPARGIPRAAPPASSGGIGGGYERLPRSTMETVVQAARRGPQGSRWSVSVN